MLDQKLLYKMSHLTETRVDDFSSQDLLHLPRLLLTFPVSQLSS